jgi:large subunit ribosomal protein L29
MDKKDLNKMTKLKLAKKLDEVKDSLVNLQFQKKLQQLENPNTIATAKKEIAQIKTVLREMDLGIREEK